MKTLLQAFEGDWDQLRKAVADDATIRGRAQSEINVLTDDICKRDYSSRAYRARLQAALNPEAPSPDEVEREHNRQMQEEIAKWRQTAKPSQP